MARLRKVFPSVEIPWETEKIVVGRVKFSGINYKYSFNPNIRSFSFSNETSPILFPKPSLVGNVYQTSVGYKAYNRYLDTNAILGIGWINYYGSWNVSTNVTIIINIWHGAILQKQIIKTYYNVTSINETIDPVFSIENIPPDDYVLIEVIYQFPVDPNFNYGGLIVYHVVNEQGVLNYQYDSSKGKYFVEFTLSVDYDLPTFEILDPEISDFIELPQKADKLIWRTPDFYGVFDYVEVYYNNILIETYTKMSPRDGVPIKERSVKGTFVYRFYHSVKPVITYNLEWTDRGVWIENYDRYLVVKLKANYHDITYKYKSQKLGLKTGSLICNDEAYYDPTGYYTYYGINYLSDLNPDLVSFYIKYRKMKDIEISAFCS
jgi:hypothetical protein